MDVIYLSIHMIKSYDCSVATGTIRRDVEKYTVKPLCNDHLYNKIYYLWLIQ